MAVDVKRVSINLENLKVQRDNAEAMLTQQINMLKYVIDYPADKTITLTPVDAASVEAVELTGLYESLPELQLLQNRANCQKSNKR